MYKLLIFVLFTAFSSTLSSQDESIVVSGGVRMNAFTDEFKHFLIGPSLDVSFEQNHSEILSSFLGLGYSLQGTNLDDTYKYKHQIHYLGFFTGFQGKVSQFQIQIGGTVSLNLSDKLDTNLVGFVENDDIYSSLVGKVSNNVAAFGSISYIDKGDKYRFTVGYERGLTDIYDSIVEAKTQSLFFKVGVLVFEK